MAAPSKSRKSRSSKTALNVQGDEKPPGEKSFILPTDKNLLELASREDYKSILRDVLDRVVMFEFFAEWCGPCKSLTAKLNELAKRYNGKLLVVKVDVDEHEELAAELNVSAIPTFMIRKDQRFVETFADSNVEKLEERLGKWLDKPEENDAAKSSKETAARK